MSENPPHRVGKIFSRLSYWGKSTTFAPGREDWNLPKISDTHRRFVVSYLSSILIFYARIMVPKKLGNHTRARRPRFP
jgi:hypothetical protein